MSSDEDDSDVEEVANSRGKRRTSEDGAGPSKKVAAAEEVKTLTSEDYAKMLAKINRNTRSTKFKKRGEIARVQKLLKKTKKKERESRKREAEALGDDAPPKKVPHTLETLREYDVSTELNDKEGEAAHEITWDDFNSYFSCTYEPKVLITTSENPLLKTRLFAKELSRLISNSEVFHRRQATVKQITKQAIEHKFTDMIVITEHQKEPSSLLISHLPKGPTAHFRLSNVKLTKHIKRDWKEMTTHRPEIVFVNFTTRLGLAVGRMIACLFHYQPEYKGRRSVTFHNQRDYIFVRHHRYEFKSGKKVSLRELGPRFTMKLKYIQKGTFDAKTGEYEWIVTNKRRQLESNRRKFYL